MNINTICQQILDFKVNSETEDYKIDIFFDEVGNNIYSIGTLNSSQKEQLIQALFTFIKNQDSEMDENFSFIHLIESIDKPDYIIYDAELLKFTRQYGTITSNILLNRHMNSLDTLKQTECLTIFKSIAENEKFSEYVRQEALHYLKYQKDK
jgi:hypothetical protein